MIRIADKGDLYMICTYTYIYVVFKDFTMLKQSQFWRLLYSMFWNEIEINLIDIEFVDCFEFIPLSA